MSRVYGDPVDVWVRDGQPARFVWRGRLYTVQGVLDRWAATRQWWHRPLPGPVAREFWRVAAAPAGSVPATYELRHDAATGGWLLTRVWD